MLLRVQGLAILGRQRKRCLTNVLNDVDNLVSIVLLVVTIISRGRDRCLIYV